MNAIGIGRKPSCKTCKWASFTPQPVLTLPTKHWLHTSSQKYSCEPSEGRTWAYVLISSCKGAKRGVIGTLTRTLVSMVLVPVHIRVHKHVDACVAMYVDFPDYWLHVGQTDIRAMSCSAEPPVCDSVPFYRSGSWPISLRTSASMRVYIFFYIYIRLSAVVSGEW